MNKKFFAALASATMALSATGSLAVFADDFVEETGNNGNVTGSVKPTASKIAWNTENFGSIQANAYDKEGKVVVATGDPYEGYFLTKAQCESITKIVYTDKAEGEIKGMNNFPNLEVFECNSAKVTSVDLSENEKLTDVTFSNAEDLAALTLPATNSLTNVTVVSLGDRAPISELDLTGNKGLSTVKINNTDIANLDVSSNVYLKDVNVANNKINTLNLDGSLKIGNVDASNNDLYSLDVPQTKTLTTLNVENNILQELDVKGLNGLVGLNVANNELRTLDLSSNKALKDLNVSLNHLGALNAPAGVTLAAPGYQYVYVNSDKDEVNLAENFEGLKDKKVTWIDEDWNGGSWDEEEGVLTIGDNYAGYYYDTGAGNMAVFVTRADLLNRLYNPNSGEHFYTKDENEKDVLVGLGWQDEGIGWVSPTESGTPVYRLYNPNAGDHHYTKSSKERDTLVSVGWKAEGIGWYSYEGFTDSKTYNTLVPAPNAVNVYREYNPNAKAAGAHNYTMNLAENDFLVSVGWLEEGVAWKAIK